MKTKKIKYCKIPSIININNNKLHLYKSKNKSIFFSAIIHSGMINETEKTAGISHLLEHLIINSWKSCSNTNCMTYLKNLGIEFNASTSSNKIIYYAYGSFKDTNLILNYLLDICNSPIFLKKNLKKEKFAVKTELLQLYNSSTYKLDKSFDFNFFQNVGLKYSSDCKLLIKNTEKFTMDDLKNWYNKYYTNITYFLIGDFNYNFITQFFKDKLPYQKCLSNNLSSLSKNIFSYSNQLIYVNNSHSKVTSIKFAFPNSFDPVYINIFNINFSCLVITNILFDYLRNKLHIIYGVSVKPNFLGNNLFIHIFINTDNENSFKVIKSVFFMLNSIKKSFDSCKFINSQKKFFNYSYNNTILNNSNNRIYNQFISQIILNKFNDNFEIKSLCQNKKYIIDFNQTIFREIVIKFLSFDNCLIAYQSSKKI